MTLDLDQQRKYLDAMGIQTWVRRNMPVQELVNEAPEPAVTLDPVAPVTAPEEKSAGTGSANAALPDWGLLRQQVSNCTACELHKTRTQAVFGVGDQNADWLIIGESPGADEDQQGEPFVGEAGQLLNAMLKAIGLEREQVYITNILKCHPGNNRHARPEEIAQCASFLQSQIALIQPKIILAVGRIAAHSLLKTETAIGKLRGQVYQYGENAIPLVVTYHPAYLNRAPHEKRKAWNDLKLAAKTYKESLSLSAK